ncbi:unnamed protein product, partial [Polarella glacialis]
MWRGIPRKNAGPPRWQFRAAWLLAPALLLFHQIQLKTPAVSAASLATGAVVTPSRLPGDPASRGNRLGGELCDGFRLLWVTVPTVTKDLDLCMVIINVALSFTPAIYCTGLALQCLGILLTCRWPLGCSRASDEAVKAWSEAQRWQMRTLAGNLKTLTFYWLCVSLARVQGSLLILHRPSRSCLEEGLPGATGLCATGLLTLSLIDLMINWTLRHLTHQSRSAELPRYSEIQLERLGYAQSTTNQFVGGMLNSLIIMTPVPWAQIIVGDATFTQVLITSAEGVLFGIV